MKKIYREMFKKIVRAYYDGNFEEEIKNILNSENADIDKEEFVNVISHLCGTDVHFSENYIEDLKNAISKYTSDHKVVDKIGECGSNCILEDGKTPCMESCPFDAVLKGDSGMRIDTDKCADCGSCVEACKRDKFLDRVEFIPLLNIIKSGKPVIAVVAPAIAGQFGENVSINKIRSALKNVGFTDMLEVAFFADMLTLKESAEFDNYVNDKKDFMITSCCCPIWVGMTRKIYKDIVKYVSPSVSPMIAAGRVIKKLNPECKVVFIGPCIAKKAEAKDKDLLGAVDFVLTFTELKDIFDALSIIPQNCSEDFSSEYASRGGRLYGRSGGVSTAVSDVVKRLYPEKSKFLTSLHVSGIKECRNVLQKAHNGEITANFIEGMGCIGGCVGGPKAIIPVKKGEEKVNETAESSAIKVSVDSSCMKNILKKIGINSNKDFKDKEKIQIFERKL